MMKQKNITVRHGKKWNMTINDLIKKERKLTAACKEAKREADRADRIVDKYTNELLLKMSKMTGGKI